MPVEKLTDVVGFETHNGIRIPVYGVIQSVDDQVRSYLKIYKERENFTKTKSWARPTKEAIEAIVKYSPIVEMGAGLGYWAKLISKAGGDIICFDAFPNKLGINHFHSSSVNPYYEIKMGFPEDLCFHSNRTLFLCWPPYDNPMASDCLTHYKGSTVIYIGEGDGGCTADDNFHETLYKDFEEIECIFIPQWDGIHDSLTIYKRKNQ